LSSTDGKTKATQGKIAVSTGKEQKKPFAIVPCCKTGEFTSDSGFDQREVRLLGILVLTKTRIPRKLILRVRAFML
jgi:hypothetical protein